MDVLQGPSVHQYFQSPTIHGVWFCLISTVKVHQLIIVWIKLLLPFGSSFHQHTKALKPNTTFHTVGDSANLCVTTNLLIMAPTSISKLM